jgi:uncharacterized protein
MYRVTVTEGAMDNRPSEDLLESTHAFPGVYHIKAIGSTEGDFAERVVSAVLEEVSGPGEVDYTVRRTPGGRHASVTIDVNVQSAGQVRAIYARIQEVDGLAYLF